MGSHGTRNWVAIAHAAAELLEGIDDVAAGNLSIDDIKADRSELREALAGVPTPVASRHSPTEPADDPPEASEATLAAALAPFGWTCGPEFWQRYYSDPWVFNLANAVERLSLFGSAFAPEPPAETRRAAVAESIYQRHADGWHAVMHEIIEPPCWNRSDPDDTEPLTADQVAWLRGDPLPPTDGAPEPPEAE